MEGYQRRPYYGTLREIGREEYRKTAGENQQLRKRAEDGMNYGY
jgi:hypothetical protein